MVRNLSLAAIVATGLSGQVSAQDAQIEAPAEGFTPAPPLSFDRTNVKAEGALTAGIWYSQAERFSGSLGVEQSTVFGTDEALRLSLDVSNYTQSALLTLTDPDFYESIYSRQLSFSVYNIQPNTAQNGDYSFSGGDARIAFGRPVGSDLTISFGLGLGETRIEDNDDLPRYIRNYIAEEGETDTALFAFLNMVIDRTTPVAFPMEGYRVAVAHEVGSSDGITYLRSQMSAQGFKPLTDEAGLRVHGSLASGGSFGGRYPIFRNFFAGGPGSVRGFAQNTLGPTSPIPDSDDLAFMGGTFRVTGGAEISTRLPWNEDLYGLAYVDVGNVFSDFESAEADDLRSAVGIGLRWDSPVGPMNLYLSQPLDKGDTAKVEEFQFTLGANF
ncbi:BamA/OMP85 family outer membrane protein [Poseidonocella pacifica]|nr:BamA/TamA family outer membrane protein [Poseidonocella pacifica]